MVVLRQYTKQGILSRPAITSVPTRNGQICYIGGELYACIDGTALQLFHYDGLSVTLEKTLDTFTSPSTTGTGAGVESNGGGKLMVTLRLDTGTPTVRFIFIRSYDIALGTTDWQAAVDTSTDEGGICFNGYQWMVSYRNTALPSTHRLLRLDVDGQAASFVLSTNLANALPTPAITCTDLCWDGVSLWTLQAGVVIHYTLDARLPPREVFRFTPAGGANSQGITTDGNDLLIMSRT
jgi:hypothetical protein